MENWNLSPHFDYFEMTTTNNDSLINTNREEGRMYLHELVDLANMMEGIRAYIKKPIFVHSGFRCHELNGVTVGSSTKSQHCIGQACDFTAMGEGTKEEVDDLFKSVMEYFVGAGVKFGQLINESAGRDYGRANWVHVSLGRPYREAYKCGQIMSMTDGTYTLLRKVDA